MDSKHPTLQDPAFVPDEFEDNNHHLALALDHYHIAYDVFLQGQDVFPEQEKALASHRVAVPLHGAAESLNVGTAATLCLYASARAQRRRGGGDA